MKSTEVKAFGAKTEKSDLEQLQINRRETLAEDVEIDILYCGVCHSDIHTVRNDWGGSKYPVIPGHEIIGKVVSVGENVSKFKEGQLVGVGCMVDSCQQCESCKEGLEQYCENGMVGTYNGKDKHLGGHTFGGYSEKIVVDQKFVLNVPENLDTKAVAPLLCAGITTWSPLRNWNVKKGDKVGVIGLGGLGHMGIKFAHALGAKVVMITTSPGKSEDAKKLGADEVLISKDEKQMAENAGSFDFLLNTVPVKHDLNPYIGLLKRDATMVMVGAIEPLEFHGGGLIMGRKSLAGSLIGGIRETQEMLDFCGEHNIVSDIEMINMQNINEAYDRVTSNDVKYRFVIDMQSLKN
ncbi:MULTISPECIES: NAD(P)-dependent alcohol dehydrogenase [Zunongwangia]|uniref:Zinc-type alcohol dehydrogenase n=2 Tax=Zunongwangia profunda TaxID=398743 RepID=D5BLM5_ZUNPS|nr:NAD(P)-dependent alcohol dehydrogenase [Zunongwangia profunda]MAG88165.1 NAD(P)-dependent alcohol dehydrogenase [Flavobacteriaceae bacterium]MAS70142.1 NAD(P)-dependent alcohol dehydrogenase [Zunongwangia sp.]ADF51991.1 zinc-type alcohol dehydrogenase [Zunongwangia profunda SM-A87]HAJ83007.1 NAD(P)-dependent alcohol dehydrogenase [Zunongwangia profunda]HCV81538.1 NAD(P)-dependent alcohol dehydrogenase [Zunongwangia profunda]|tara:strand:+ start:4792 stop:5844 length:1053 start_codon:yes stop_codon:yes gene_type:complete